MTSSLAGVRRTVGAVYSVRVFSPLVLRERSYGNENSIISAPKGEERPAFDTRLQPPLRHSRSPTHPPTDLRSSFG